MAIFNVNESSLNSYLNEARASVKHRKQNSSGSYTHTVHDVKGNEKEYTGKSPAEAYHKVIEDEVSNRKFKNIAPSLRGTLSGKTHVGLSKTYTVRDSNGNETKHEYSEKEHAKNVDQHLHDTGKALAMSIAKAKREGRDADVKYLTARAKNQGGAKQKYYRIESVEQLKEAAEYILSVLDESEKKWND